MENLISIIKTILNIKKYEIKKEGVIYYIDLIPNQIEEKYIIGETIQALLYILKQTNNTFKRISTEYDEFLRSITVNIEFDTVEGWKNVRKNVLAYTSKIEETEYKAIKSEVEQKILNLFEEYNIIVINNIKIQIY